MIYIRALLFFIAGFFAQLGFILTGPAVVLIALPFAKNNHLPRCAWPWGNEEDGINGDNRGWYWYTYCPEWWPNWFRSWWWLVVRNPANNAKRYWLGFDVRSKKIETIAGQDYVRDDLRSTGWQLVKAGRRFHLYVVKRYGSSTRALVIELGNKFQVRHNGVRYADPRDYWKGFTFEVNPYKDIE